MLDESTFLRPVSTRLNEPLVVYNEYVESCGAVAVVLVKNAEQRTTMNITSALFARYLVPWFYDALVGVYCVTRVFF